MTVDSIDRRDPRFTLLGLRGPAPDFRRASLHVIETGRAITLGDSITAEGSVALWTPRGLPSEPVAGVDYAIPIPLAPIT